MDENEMVWCQMEGSSDLVAASQEYHILNLRKWVVS